MYVFIKPLWSNRPLKPSRLGSSTFSIRTSYPLECCGGSKYLMVGAQLSECSFLTRSEHSLIIDVVHLIIPTFFSGIRYGQSFLSSELDYLIGCLVRPQQDIVATRLTFSFRLTYPNGSTGIISVRPWRHLVWYQDVHDLRSRWNCPGALGCSHRFVVAWPLISSRPLYIS